MPNAASHIAVSICGSATASCRESTCYAYRKRRRHWGALELWAILVLFNQVSDSFSPDGAGAPLRRRC